MNRLATSSQWIDLREGGSAKWLKYSTGTLTANSVAARLADETWMVISPAANPSRAAVELLAADGGASALVAPNANHSMGQLEWRECFPAAKSFAPRRTHPALAKSAPDIEFLPIEDLYSRLRLGDDIFEPDGLKSPDLIVRLKACVPSIWWMGDLLGNTSKADLAWWFRLFASALRSGPGLRSPYIMRRLYLEDRKSWATSLLWRLAAAPPDIIIPAHGDPISVMTHERVGATIQHVLNNF